jgi:hypothetical protein
MNAHVASPLPANRHRSATFAVTVTAAAALAAWFLAAVIRLPEQAVVLTVMTVSFAISWSITNRRSAVRRPTHRVTMVPVRTRTG